ncbi:MAG: AIM24 family protein [Chloroflexia bacterium]
MTKLKFSHSTCQVEGTYVPVADVNLASGEAVYFSHHMLLWQDPQVALGILPVTDGWKRYFDGMPLLMTEATGPGHIAFSRDEPGEIIALPLHQGESVDAREHTFIMASSKVTYDWFNPHVWYATKAGRGRDLHFPIGVFMDRLDAQDTPGLVLLHGAGNVFVRTLEEGDSILVKPTSLVFKDSTVSAQLRLEYPDAGRRFWIGWSMRYIWLELTGPGRVAIQSAFKHLQDNGSPVIDGSFATKTTR